VRVKLRSIKLIPEKIYILKKSESFSLAEYLRIGNGIKDEDLKLFTRQFSTLISAGIPISDSLKILEEGFQSKQFKLVLNKLRTNIESGRTLSESMAQRGDVFDRFYVNMVSAGEKAGILDGILGRLSVYIEKADKIQKQVKGALWYPGVVTAVSGLIIWAILYFLIPKFAALYASGGRELPFLTQQVMALSDFVREYWHFFLGFMIGIPLSVMSFYKTEQGKEFFDELFISLPVFGTVVQKGAVAKMTRTLSTLLSSGVGVVEAIDIAAKTAGNSVIEKSLNQCRDSVIGGKPLAVPMFQQKRIPHMVSHMVNIGEQSGNLDVLLSKMADFYEEDIETAIKSATSLIEPILMVVLGSIIAVLVLAMYLPVFEMGSVAGG
jgi:type IV pilus assembly protein PilC